MAYFTKSDDIKLYSRIKTLLKKEADSSTPYYKGECPESGETIYITPSTLVQSKGGLIDCPEGPRKLKNIRPASLSDKLFPKKKKKKSSGELILSKRATSDMFLSKRSCHDCYVEGAEQGLSEREMDRLISERHPGNERKRKKNYFGQHAEKILAEVMYPKYDVAHMGYSEMGVSEMKNMTDTLEDVDPHGDTGAGNINLAM